ncbi:MAG: universal stress protein [Planctomycetota bacterium]
MLGVKGVFIIGFGDVGSSIFYALGVTAAFALGATPLAILIAGIFFACTVLTYMELSAAMPEPGGSQIFARRAFNDIASFTAGWALLLDYILTAAISAYTIAPYLSQFWSFLATPGGKFLFSSGLVAFLAVLNIIGIRESTTLSLVLGIASGLTKLLLIVLGFLFVFSLPTLIGQIHLGTSPNWKDFFTSITIAMVAYTGIEASSQLAGEAKDPGRTMPRALRMVLGSILFLFLGLSLVAVCAVPPGELGTKYIENPLLPIAQRLPYAGFLVPWVGILAGALLLIATNAGVIGASRLAFSMANHYQLPGTFRTLHGRFRTPWFSLLVFPGAAILTIGFSILLSETTGKSTTEILANLYNFGAMLAFSMAHLSVLGLRAKEPNLARPYRIPWNIRIMGRDFPITAILGLLATASAWILIVWTKPWGRALGLVWMVLGFILYANYRKRARIPVSRKVEIEPVSIPEYSELKFARILVPTRGGAETETVQVAARLAKASGAELIALYVMEVPQALPMESFLPDEVVKGTQALERAEAVSREQGIPVETKLMQSRAAAETIVEFARERACDLVVIGAKPRAVPGSILGRTVDHVLKSAPCRVWVLSMGAKVPAPLPPSPPAAA